MSILLTPAELADMMAQGQAPLVLDVRWALTMSPQSGEHYEQYRAAHIPSAQFVNLEEDLTDHAGSHNGVGGRHPLPDPAVFTAAMQRVGLQPGRVVVVYDAKTSISAARLWWLLTDAGHQHTYVLDGGFQAWVDAGLPTEQGDTPNTVASTWQPATGHRGRVEADGVEASVASGYRVIDVRAAERFAGDVEPIDPVAGHIPGAVNVPATLLQHPDGTFKSREDIEAVMGTISDGDILYCGSGITASQALLALEARDICGAVIYPGSWSEWCRIGKPVETSAE